MNDSEYARELYNRIAKYYMDERLNKITSNAAVEEKHVLVLLGNVKGKKILDAGCGFGYYSSRLKSRGADIIGIDISDENVRLARERGVDALRVDVSDLGMFEDSSFDIVLSVLVIDYMKDISRFLKEAFRVLKKGGFLVLTNMHPMKTAGIWTKDDSSEHIQFIADNYFDRRKINESWYTDEDGNTMSFSIYHRTLQEHFDALLDAGFSIDRFVEARPMPDLKEKCPPMYEKLSRIPKHVIFRARKND